MFYINYFSLEKSRSEESASHSNETKTEKSHKKPDVPRKRLPTALIIGVKKCGTGRLHNLTKLSYCSGHLHVIYSVVPGCPFPHLSSGVVHSQKS